MGKLVRGDVVVIPFPFTDLTGSKKRPAFVVANLPGDDAIVCQITSKYKSDNSALLITPEDFCTGALPVESYIRPNKIFTADKSLILSIAGHLSDSMIHKALAAVIAVISS